MYLRLVTFLLVLLPLQARLFGPDGSVQDTKASAQGPDLIVTLPDGLAHGTHALSWRVVSDDGHPVGGSHLFSIGFETGTPDAAPEALPWFAALARGALTLALVLVLTGAALAWRQVEAPAALVGTDYGWVLTAKLVLVALVLALAARHRLSLTPQLAQGAPTARPMPSTPTAPPVRSLVAN